MCPVLKDVAPSIAEGSNRCDANTEWPLGTQLLYQNCFIFEYYTIKFTNGEFYVHGPENSLKELLRNSSLQQSKWKLDFRDQEHMV